MKVFVISILTILIGLPASSETDEVSHVLKSLKSHLEQNPLYREQQIEEWSTSLAEKAFVEVKCAAVMKDKDNSYCYLAHKNLMALLEEGVFEENSEFAPLETIVLRNQPGVSVQYWNVDHVSMYANVKMSIDEWRKELRRYFQSASVGSLEKRSHNLFDRHLKLENAFGRRIEIGSTYSLFSGWQELDDSEYEQALGTLEQVVESMQDLFSTSGFKKTKLLDKKVFEIIRIGTRSQDSFEDSGKMVVEIHWNDTPENLRSLLFRQPNMISTSENSSQVIGYSGFETDVLIKNGILKPMTSEEYYQIAFLGKDLFSDRVRLKHQVSEISEVLGGVEIGCQLNQSQNGRIRKPNISVKECLRGLNTLRSIVNQTTLEDFDFNQIQILNQMMGYKNTNRDGVFQMSYAISLSSLRMGLRSQTREYKDRSLKLQNDAIRRGRE